VQEVAVSIERAKKLERAYGAMKAAESSRRIHIAVMTTHVASRLASTPGVLRVLIYLAGLQTAVEMGIALLVRFPILRAHTVTAANCRSIELAGRESSPSSHSRKEINDCVSFREGRWQRAGVANMCAG
jgi:predicted peptidase